MNRKIAVRIVGISIMILSPFVLLVLIELGLRIFGYGNNPDYFVKRKIGGKTTYTNNIKYSEQVFPKSDVRYPFNFKFSADKSDKTFRIFVLGASAAMGDPAPSFSFSRILEKMLSEVYPEVNFEVINTAITAINSNIVVNIAKECADKDPDLFIVYMGNNEVVGPYGPTSVLMPFLTNNRAIRFHLFMKSTRLGQFISNIRVNERQGNSSWGGMELFLRHKIAYDSPDLESVYRNFEINLRRICSFAEGEGIPVFLSTVASNLNDSPPFWSLNDRSLTDGQLNQWKSFYEKGNTRYDAGEYAAAIDLYSQAKMLDSTYAELAYRLGDCYANEGKNALATHHYALARNYDALRFRTDNKLNTIVKKMPSAVDYKKLFVLDIEEVFKETVRQGDSQGEHFLEHVHFNFEGNFLLAKTYLERIVKGGVIDERFSGRSVAKQEALEAMTSRKYERQLAYNSFEQHSILKSIGLRMSRPPFTNQLNHAQGLESIQMKRGKAMKAIRSDTTKALHNDYRAAINLAPDDWAIRENYVNYRIFLGEKGDGKALISELQNIVAQMPNNYSALNNIGIFHYLNGDYDLAETHYKKALAINPNYNHALKNLGSLNIVGKALKYTATTPDVEGDQVFNQYIEPGLDLMMKSNADTSEMLDALNKLGELLIQRKKEALGEKVLNRSLDLSKKNEDALTFLGRLYFQKKAYNKSAVYMEDLISANPSLIEPYVSLGDIYSLQKQFDIAIEYYEKANTIGTRDARLLNKLGYTYGLIGQIELSVNSFKEAIQLEPGFLEARQNLLVAYMIGNQKESARGVLKEITQLDPENARTKMLKEKYSL